MALPRQASSFYGLKGYPLKTMRDIVDDIIKPCCSRSGTSYALSLNPEGLPVEAFVSHNWDGHFFGFIQSIQTAFQTKPKKPNLWICAFALAQVQGQDAGEIVSQQVGSSDEPLEDCPFVLAIGEAKYFCIVRNCNVDVYRRIWCVCELMYAKHHGLFPDNTDVTGPDTFIGQNSSVLDAEATRLDDRDRILRVLLTDFNRAEIDSRVEQLRTQAAPLEL